MRTLRYASMIALVALFTSTGSLSAQDKIRVYVTSAGEKEGFVAAGADDSVLDLTKAINKKKRLTTVESRDDADVVVLVENRESHWENGRVTSWTDSKGKTHTYQPLSNTRVVHAALQVGEYKLPLHGENVTWSGASDKVADDVAKWVDANLVRLIARREDRKP